MQEIKIIKAGNDLRRSIISLLQSEKLPFEDLPAVLENFYLALESNRVIGVIGLEKYNDCGLLRSMVVDKQFRNKNVAAKLIDQLELEAGSLGIDSIYLFTETASSYFERKGYKKIERTDVPDPIKASTEFSSVCPVSAIVMRKSLK